MPFHCEIKDFSKCGLIFPSLNLFISPYFKEDMSLTFKKRKLMLVVPCVGHWRSHEIGCVAASYIRFGYYMYYNSIYIIFCYRHLRTHFMQRTGAVGRASDFGPRGPGSIPVRGVVCCGL